MHSSMAVPHLTVTLTLSQARKLDYKAGRLRPSAFKRAPSLYAFSYRVRSRRRIVNPD